MAGRVQGWGGSSWVVELLTLPRQRPSSGQSRLQPCPRWVLKTPLDLIALGVFLDCLNSTLTQHFGAQAEDFRKLLLAEAAVKYPPGCRHKSLVSINIYT